MVDLEATEMSGADSPDRSSDEFRHLRLHRSTELSTQPPEAPLAVVDSVGVRPMWEVQFRMFEPPASAPRSMRRKDTTR